ncbi:aspartate/glutamate racemase family protein (plasmid) [Thioclava sp. 'Guangxiensis']|uniref:aspartate/glutamate racemase family protein n=1 Tax=Thioclava sp. 'Guangxiensis' TaxID=3149044 RepID=UPI0032C47406
MDKPLVVMINPNSSTVTTARMVHIGQEMLGDRAIALEGRTASTGPAMLTTPETLTACEAQVLAMAEALPPRAGIIVSAFGDPAMDRLRAQHDGPVTGIGEASFLEAGRDGRRFGIATTTPALDAAIRARVAASGRAAQLSGISYTGGDPFVLTADPQALFEALKRAAEAEAAKGAEAVIIGGGPLAQVAQRLEAETGLPIIAPIPAAIRHMVRLLAGG